MTATVVNGINANHRRILMRFVAGRNPEQIAQDTGYNVPTVTAVIEKVAGGDKARAAELVRQYELDVAGDDGESEPRPPTPEPPKLAASVRPAVRDLLDEAEATGDRYLVVRVQKVRALLDEIRERIAEARETQEARAEVARLEAELAAAKARLKGGRPAAPAPVPESRIANHDEPSAADLRAWAAERGIDCPAMGRIPKAVREAWNAEVAA